MVTAEIITIGDEILFGHILNTNTQWISNELSKIGITVNKQLTIGDDLQTIVDTFQQAQYNAQLVIVTGGLGPTNDDITKKAFCKFFDVSLARNQEVYNHLDTFFKERNRVFTDKQQTQSDIPSNGSVLMNHRGTAPGMWFEWNNTIYISLPGVPVEMKGIMTDYGFDRIKANFQLPIILHHTIKTIGIGESTLSDVIKDWEEQLPNNIKLAYLPSLGEVKLRLTTYTDPSQLEQAKVRIEQLNLSLLQLIEPYVYGYNDDTIEKAVITLLNKSNFTLSTVESCTGGYIAHTFTEIAGASQYFKGSVVAYANEIKTTILDIPSTLIEKNGAVSQEVVEAMALNGLNLFNSHINLATSGIAGPEGGTPDKPVGTVWVAIADKNGVESKCLHLTKQRLMNIQLTKQHLLYLLFKKLKNSPPTEY
jgi:nicotinamide-nucleotide amidase